jgi:ABC-type Zn2+ transport system substrate-binding protein/surface adhesin
VVVCQHQQQFYRSDAGHGHAKIYDVHYWYAPTSTAMVLKMTLPQIYTDPYMQAMGEQVLNELEWAAGASGSSVWWCLWP